MLNKKKKREETKEVGASKKVLDNQKKISTKLNNLNYFENMANLDYQNYLMKNHYEMPYPPYYFDGMKQRGLPIQDPQLLLRMNNSKIIYNSILTIKLNVILTIIKNFRRLF